MDPTQPFPHVYWQTDMKNGFGSVLLNHPDTHSQNLAHAF